MEQKNMIYEGLYLDYFNCISKVSMEKSSNFVNLEDVCWEMKQKYDEHTIFNILLNATTNHNMRRSIIPNFNLKLLGAISTLECDEDIIALSTTIHGGFQHTVDANNNSLLVGFEKVERDDRIEYYFYNKEHVDLIENDSVDCISDLKFRYCINSDGSISLALLFKLDEKPLMVKINKGDQCMMCIPGDGNKFNIHRAIQVLTIIKENK